MSFTLADLVSTAAAIVVFPLFIFVPGYVFGWLLDLALFRQSSRLLRILLSLPLSLALTPVVIYLLGRQFSISGVWLFYALVWLSFPIVLVRSARPHARWPANLLRPVTLISVAWIAVAVLSLVDLQFGHRLFFSAVSYDYTVRSAAVSALARTHWYPPANPFFYPGHAEPFRYHYFWFMLCSWPVRLAPAWIGPRTAIFGGVVWIGFTLLATVAIYLRFFHQDDGRAIRRRTLAAFALLALSGFDILPTLLLDFLRLRFHFGNIFASVDWWNPDQVTGWLDSALWVPHHLAGLLACLAGFLILWIEWRLPDHPLRWQAVVGAALAFASAGGLSVYVAFAFAAFLGLWVVFDLFRRNYRELASLALAGILALLLGMPFIHDLLAAGSAGTSSQAAGASFVRLGVRIFQPAYNVLNLLHHNTPVTLAIADFLLLPLNFLIELGVLFLIGFIKLRQLAQRERPFTPAARAGLLMIAAALFISMFLRSNTIDSNDLGMRGMLIVQFVLVLWGADVLLEWRDRREPSSDRWIRMSQSWLAAAFILGALTNLYEIGILRTFTMLTEAGMQPGQNYIGPGSHLAERAFYARQMYAWLDLHIPSDAVEQHDPFASYDLIPGLYANRQVGLADPGSALAFGGNPAESKRMARSLRTIFDPHFGHPQLDILCRQYKIGYWLVRNDSPVWNDPQSWVWQRKPLYSNPGARAFSCGAP